jgi:ABC-type maltose transport system permease subunit
VGVRGFAGQSYATVFRNLLFCASASLSLVPVFAIFVMFQRCLVPGISTTGIKG